MGCSLCRSEKLTLISDNEEATIGANLENRADMKARFDHVLGHGLDREMEIRRVAQPEEERKDVPKPAKKQRQPAK